MAKKLFGVEEVADALEVDKEVVQILMEERLLRFTIHSGSRYVTKRQLRQFQNRSQTWKICSVPDAEVRAMTAAARNRPVTAAFWTVLASTSGATR